MAADVRILIRIRKVMANPVILPLLSQGNSYSPAPLDLSNVVLSRELQVSIGASRTACFLKALTCRACYPPKSFVKQE